MHFTALVLLSFVITCNSAHENQNTGVCMALWKYKIFTCINWVKIGLRELSIFNENICDPAVILKTWTYSIITLILLLHLMDYSNTSWPVIWWSNFI